MAAKEGKLEVIEIDKKEADHIDGGGASPIVTSFLNLIKRDI